MNDWITARSQQESLRFLEEVSGLLSDLGGPLTKDLAKLVAEGKFVELVNYKFDYNLCHDLRDVTLARQVHALFQKQEWMDIGIDTRAVAEAKFWEMEERCKDTNLRVDERRLSAGLYPILHRTRLKIAHILGKVPSLSSLKFSFGPGATTNVKGRVASPRSKLSAELVCSRDSFSAVGSLLQEAPLWSIHHAGLTSVRPKENVCTVASDGTAYMHDPEASSVVLLDVLEHAGKLTYVPKDARSMRPIVVEPTLNGFAQKGIGSYLKSQMLKRVGLDLSDQSRNQRLAREGSISGRFATVDMSSASDTVSWSVVRELLPWEWFEFLATWRTGDIEGPNGPHELHKFSSMGNGFTFELESLIFYSLAVACLEVLDLSSEVSTFGDDVIIDTQAYTLYRDCLTELGFIVNNEKSFFQGPFRESCGADWLMGDSVRPFYAKKQMSEQTLYTFHNFAVRNCEPELASLILSWTEPSMRLFGPDGYGDGHLVGSYSLRSNRRSRRGGWDGGFFDSYVSRANRLKKRYPGDWLFPSYSVYTRMGERDPTDPDVVRGSGGYAKASIYTSSERVFSRYL
jgi:hypothetical protein